MNEKSRDKHAQDLSRAAWWILGSLSLAAVAVIITLRWWWGDSIPPLEPSQFYEARAKWDAAGPQDYEIEIVVTGSQPATYEVHVRNGQAEVALRNGQPLRQRRTLGTWSVPGMFSTIQRDVAPRFSQPKRSRKPPLSSPCGRSAGGRSCTAI